MTTLGAGEGLTTGDQAPPLPPLPLARPVTAPGGDGPTTGDRLPPTPPLPGGAPAPAPAPSPAPEPAPAPAPGPAPAPVPVPGRLGTNTVLADAAPLLAVDSAQALQAQVAGEAVVSAGTTWVVRPGAEVRSSTNLSVVGDWALPSASAVSATDPMVQAGGLALTLRAEGQLNLGGSLSAGFSPGLDGAAITSWAPTDARAGDIRLHAGGDLTIGNPADAGGFTLPPVLLRNTTGALDIQAGGRIQLAHAGAAVYTTGTLQQPARSPDLGLFGQLLGLVEGSGGELLSPYLSGGGRLTVTAGGDVTGLQGAAALPTDWAWRGQDGSYGYRWSRFDRFSGGVASFGGGDLTVRAGGSIVDLAAASADSGWLGTGAIQAAWAAATSEARASLPLPSGHFAAGTLSLVAGGDIVGGNVWAAGPALTLAADGRIGQGGVGVTAPDLVWQGTSVSVQARGDVTLDRLQTTGLTATSFANTAGDQVVFNGLGQGARMTIGSTTGSIALAGAAGSGEVGESTSFGGFTASLPGVLQITSPAGDVSLLGSPRQLVDADGVLSVLAGGSVWLGNLTVPAGGTPTLPQVNDYTAVLEALAQTVLAQQVAGALALDGTSRSAVHVATGQGDIVWTGATSSARPVRAVAGRDLVFQGAGQLLIQHQDLRFDGAGPAATSELSLLQAGRDITASAGTAVSGLTVAGPGDLVLLAGRDIDLGAGRGVQAVGNQRNSTLLPASAAQITAVAGYRAGTDVSAATGLYASAGGLALAGSLTTDPATGRTVSDPQAATLYGFLAGGDAAAFGALPTAVQLEAVAALAGGDFEAWVLRWMRTSFALGVGADAAAAQAQALATSLQGDALAQRVMADVKALPDAQQPARALRWLVDDAVRRSLPLAGWLRATLAATLDGASATAALDSLVAANDARAAAAVGGLLVQALAAAPADRQAAYVADRRAALEASESQRLQDWFNGRGGDAAFVARMGQALGLGGPTLPVTFAEVARAWEALADDAARRAALPALDQRAWTLDPAQALLERSRGLDTYLARVGVDAPSASALQAFAALPAERQLPWLAEVLRSDLAAAGEAAAGSTGAAFDGAYARAYQALDWLFPQTARPGAGSAGNIVLPTSQIRTAQTAGITLLAPGGGINAGALVSGAVVKKANELGIVTVAGGPIFSAVRDDFEVNQSRVFTLEVGDIVLWASDGNVDAGRGAKTVSGAPAPVLRLDDDGNLVLDTSGSFSGSGIAALSADSSVGLFAPRGEVNAGEAGIRSAGNLTVAAAQVRGADNIAVAGQTSGDTGVAAVGTTASLAATAQSAGAATAAAAAAPGDEDDPRKRRKRRNLFLDFLGFGSGDD